MKGQIRKISVGQNYPDGVLHYQVGKIINLAGNPYEVAEILLDEEILKNTGRLLYNIYLASDKGKVLWKYTVDVSVVVEHNINFL